MDLKISQDLWYLIDQGKIYIFPWKEKSYFENNHLEKEI